MNIKKRIILVEENRLIRAGFQSLFSLYTDYEIVGEACNGLDAIECAKECDPDLIITELIMPRMNGIEVIKEIKKHSSHIKILVLTTYRDEDRILSAFQSGADGYLIKDSSVQELEQAINYILDGNLYICPRITQGIIGLFIDSKRPNAISYRDNLITHREKEVLKLIAEGYTNKEIARFLSISVRTAEKHRENIMEKLGLHTTAALTTFALEKGIVQSSS